MPRPPHRPVRRGPAAAAVAVSPARHDQAAHLFTAPASRFGRAAASHWACRVVGIVEIQSGRNVRRPGRLVPGKSDRPVTDQDQLSSGGDLSPGRLSGSPVDSSTHRAFGRPDGVVGSFVGPGHRCAQGEFTPTNQSPGPVLAEAFGQAQAAHDHDDTIGCPTMRHVIPAPQRRRPPRPRRRHPLRTASSGYATSSSAAGCPTSR